MKNYAFKVYFEIGDPVTVYCGNDIQAKILGQAERIKAGLVYEVTRVQLVG